MKKRMLETLMAKETVKDFGLDVDDLIKVRRKDGTFYVYKEEVSEETYKEFMKLEWNYSKKRQRDFDYLNRNEITLLSLDRCKENEGFEVIDDVNIEELAETHLMLEVLEEEINKLPEIDRKLMNLVFHTDLTQRQLAEILGISQGVINKKIKKNKEKLQKKLIK